MTSPVRIDLSFGAAAALNNAVRCELDRALRRRQAGERDGSLQLGWREYVLLLEEAKDAIATACGATS